ncbi:nucleotide exchange factor GrpE [Gammaproteobacteria bacterium]|jgi:molecular chaperone GrpE|nr:nucleotide exchange factor GrpE [Gammaproteobacteria bacterium]MDB9909817.1 nucleotide exchange factor GrpE [Gammaproteobacteria bacterium]MDC3397862.1 nucleotide exchange factor GrpE [Gammaproteobacteria bacterium]
MMAKKNKTTNKLAPESDDRLEDVVDESGIEDLAFEAKEISEVDPAEDNAEEKIHNLEEALLRSRAELDNALKRSVVDIEKAHKYGVERLLNELLPVVDNLEHALKNFSEESSAEDKEGVELTLKSFESALDKFGIRPIYPINEQFDPVKHEAVMTSQDPEKENNEIENIFQRGWELHERVVRPARVSVIKN